MVDMLADPVGAQHEAAGPERARMQPLDRLRVVGGFGQNRQCKIVHGRRGIASCGGGVHRPVPANFAACQSLPIGVCDR